jgi:polysaccharide biosynthesis transport protein
LSLPGSYPPPSIDLSGLPLKGRPAAPPTDLRVLIGGLFQRWKLITAVPVILLLMTGVVLHLVPPRFQSSVQLLMFDPQQAGLDAIGPQPASPSDRDLVTTALTTEIAVINSTSLALRVAKDLDLAHDPEFRRQSGLGSLFDKLGFSENGWAGARLRRLFEAIGLYNANDSKVQEPIAVGRGEAEVKAKEVATAATLLRREHISVERVPFSYVLAVSATSRSPETAQRLASKVVDDYLAGLREGRQQALQQMAGWLKAKLAELKTRVVETETTIEKLKAESGFSDTGRGSVSEQQVADLNGQLMLARAEVAEKRAQLEQASQISNATAGPEDVPEGTASSIIAELRLQKSRLTQREARLRDELGDRNPEVLATGAELADVNKAINQESVHARANLRNSYDIAMRRQQSLETSLQRLASAQNSSGDYVKLQQLQRIADADSKLYDTYLAQYNEIETRKSLQTFGPKIISPAAIPTEPNFPAKSIYLVIGFIGVVVGVSLAFLLDHLQAGVKTSAQAQYTFGHPVVGALPLMRRRQSRGADKTRDLVQAIVDAPMSALSEAVRAVRVSLRLSNPDQTPMVVLVTSSLPGEGKSSIAMLLGASSAGAGERTVVVDCDLRGRTISREFDEQQPGLTDVVIGTAAIGAVAVRHPIAGCDVIPAGSRSHAPADLLASRRLAEVIARLRERYAYIIVDTPPLLSVVDAVALATIADKILIAIDSTRTRSQTVAESFRLLQPETNRVAGMVFNKVAPDQLRRYGAGAYY